MPVNSQLFSQKCKLPAILLFARETPMPAIENLKEWSALHFPQLSIKRGSKNFTTACFGAKENSEQTVLVAGAFGRSRLSTILKNNFIANNFVDDYTAIFLAHS